MNINEFDFHACLKHSLREVKAIPCFRDCLIFDGSTLVISNDFKLDTNILPNIYISDFFKICCIDKNPHSDLVMHQALISFVKSYNEAVSALEDTENIVRLFIFMNQYAEIQKCIGCMLSAVKIGLTVDGFKKLKNNRSAAAKKSHSNKINVENILINLLEEISINQKNKFKNKKSIFDYIFKHESEKLKLIINYHNENIGSRSRVQDVEEFIINILNKNFFEPVLSKLIIKPVPKKS